MLSMVSFPASFHANVRRILQEFREPLLAPCPLWGCQALLALGLFLHFGLPLG